MKKICKNCMLYNPDTGACLVTVLVSGEKFELPVNPNDSCHWERLDEEINQELNHKLGQPYFKAKLEAETSVPISIKQIRTWSDGKNGFVETSG